jgi:hypothetical protein
MRKELPNFDKSEVAPALRLTHGEPGRAWRLSELAKQVGTSRTSFALRFKANAGVGPLTYLQNLRVSLAGSVGFVKGRCQSLSWPSPWAVRLNEPVLLSILI